MANTARILHPIPTKLCWLALLIVFSGCGARDNAGNDVTTTTLFVKFSEDFAASPRMNILQHLKSASSVTILDGDYPLDHLPPGASVLIFGNTGDWRRWSDTPLLDNRAEAFAMQNGPKMSFLDGLGNGLGYSMVLVLVAFFRELFGSGSLFGVQVLSKATEGGWYTPNGLMLLSPSAFFLIGLGIWVLRTWKTDQIEEN